MSDNPRQDLYLEISQNLVDRELQDLRNYVSGASYLSEGFVEKANGHQIFIQLEKEGKLKPGDLSLLANILRKIGRHVYADQAEKIAENEKKEIRKPKVPAKRPGEKGVGTAVAKAPRTQMTHIHSEDVGDNSTESSSRQTEGRYAKDVIHGYTRGDFETLKRLLTEVKVEDGTHTDTYNRLARHVAESGLTFRAEVPKDGNCMFHAVADQLFRTEGRRPSHVELRKQTVNFLRDSPYNANGDHLRSFVTGHRSWEVYLDTMSRDGTWGDHIHRRIQDFGNGGAQHHSWPKATMARSAMADMFGHDVSIVSSVEAENYVTILTPSTRTVGRKEPPLLLGHYAENHYASLDVKSPGQVNTTSTQHRNTNIKHVGKRAVLLVNDEYGTAKGGVSTMNLQTARLLRSKQVKVYNTVLYQDNKANDIADAQKDGVLLLFPKLHDGDEREPSLGWLTYDHLSRYPSLPEDIGYIIGHVDITSKAARRLKEDRLPHAEFFLFGHVIPEDTEHYKSEERAMGIGDKCKAIQDDMEHADAIFSVGPVIYDYYQNQMRESRPHFMFLPKPCDIFRNTEMTYVKTQTKGVLSIGRVVGAEKLKGHDLAAKAMKFVIERFPRAKWRLKGIRKDDFQRSKEIIEANIRSGSFHFTPLEYGTQEDLCRDIQQAHVVLMVSRAEPFGLVGLEAIAAGVPVIISERSGLAEFIRTNLDAEFDRNIVEMEGDDEEDAKRLAKKIIKILENGKKEHDAAQKLKDKLWKSKYWEKSHKQFLQACGVDDCSSSAGDDVDGGLPSSIPQKQLTTVPSMSRGDHEPQLTTVPSMSRGEPQLTTVPSMSRGSNSTGDNTDDTDGGLPSSIPHAQKQLTTVPSMSRGEQLTTVPSMSRGMRSVMDRPVNLTSTQLVNNRRQVVITPEAAEILSRLPPRPVDVVSVVGPMRKGKSHLANLLCKRKAGFPLGDKLESETEDFWFWIGPHPVQFDRYIMVIDTEGLGDYADEEHYEKDLKYLVLATLFSNHLVFNLQGNLDHTFLSQLRLMGDLSEHVRVQKDGEDEGDLGDHFPELWVAVQNTHLVPPQGLSPDDYLEVVFERKKGHTKAIKAHNGMTDAVKDFFPKRHLRLIPPPTADRDTLRNLDKVKDDVLQKEYNDAVDNFTREVWNSGLVKTINREDIKTTGLLDIMRYYVSAINDPKAMPSVLGAYEAMVEGECRRAVDEHRQMFMETVEKTVKPSMPIDEEDCRRRIQTVVDGAVSKLCSDVGKWDKSETWMKYLQDELEKERLSLLQLNSSKSKALCDDILQEIDQYVRQKLGSGAYNIIGGFDVYVRDMDVVYNTYKSSAFGKGPAVETVLETFRTTETTRRSMIKDTEQKLIENDKRLKEEQRKNPGESNRRYPWEDSISLDDEHPASQTSRSAGTIGDLIVDNFVRLRERLQVGKLIPYFIQRRLLDFQDKEVIMSKTTTENRAEALLVLLSKKGTCTPEVFVDILRLGDHRQLAEMLSM